MTSNTLRQLPGGNELVDMTPVVKVRAIEYTTVPRDMASLLAMSPAEVKTHFHDMTDLAIVKCVDSDGRKLTAVGDPNDLQAMLRNGRADRRDDLELARSRWPVLLQGWPEAS
jgi:hypothetical protein